MDQIPNVTPETVKHLEENLEENCHGNPFGFLNMMLEVYATEVR